MGQIAWSYSALASFETCSRRHYLTRISKEVPDPPGEAIKWGNRVHEALEAYLLHDTPLPEGMESYAVLADKIKAKGAEPGADLTAERKICLNESYKPAEYFARNAWVRGVLDVSVKKGTKLFVGDWKTGKVKPDSDQLKLFAALAMSVDPEVNEVVTAFLWVAQGKLTADRFTREDVAGIWNEFLPRVARMESASVTRKYPPKPSGLCRAYCPCTGCEYNGKRGS